MPAAQPASCPAAKPLSHVTRLAVAVFCALLVDSDHTTRRHGETCLSPPPLAHIAVASNAPSQGGRIHPPPSSVRCSRSSNAPAAGCSIPSRLSPFITP
eukprot:2759412-Rhodomonas_salina.2